MLAARAQAFAVVTEGGAAAFAVAWHGCGGWCAWWRPRRGGCLQRVGDPAFRGDYGEDLRLVRRLLR
jgi:hypothetical protein